MLSDYKGKSEAVFAVFLETWHSDDLNRKHSEIWTSVLVQNKLC